MFEKSCVVSPDCDEMERGQSKSPAQLTEGISVCLDWVSFTLPVDHSVESVAETFIGLPLSSFRRVERPLNGYAVRHTYGHVMILSDGGVERGVHVDFSGQGVRWMEDAGFAGAAGWAQYFERVFLYGGHFSRVDAASDLRFPTAVEMPFTFEDVLSHLERGDWRGHWGGFSPQMTYRKVSDKVSGVQKIETVGRSVYVGSKASRLFLCVYDKGMEQRSKGVVVDGQWLRLEVRFKAERADAVASLVASGSDASEWFCSVLGEYLSFLEPLGSDSNISRRPVAKWWSDFLGGVAKVKLTSPQQPKTFEQKNAWLLRQVAISLEQVRLVIQGDDDDGEPDRMAFVHWFRDFVRHGRDSMTESHFQQVSDWRVCRAV